MAARGKIESLKEELRLRLVQKVDLANGFQAIERGDPFTSLAWFADALQLERGDPSREEAHRTRLAVALRQCPKLAHVLFHDGVVWHAAFSPDGRRVLTASGDKTARVWDAATGEPITPPIRHEEAVLHAAFSPNGLRVVTAGYDNAARVWDAATGEPISPPMKHENVLYHAAFSPDGLRIVTASYDNTARVWDAATGEPISPPLRHEGA